MCATSSGVKIGVDSRTQGRKGFDARLSRSLTHIKPFT